MPGLDDVSFDDCYRRVYPLVLAKCRRMLRGDSDANDLAQEVFVRLWKNREFLRDPATLTAWLYRTSTRLVIDRARKRVSNEDAAWHLNDLLQAQTSADCEARFVGRERLRNLVASCSEARLEAAILSRLDRLTQPEVAEVMGTSERTVRRLLDRFDQQSRSLEGTDP